MFVKDFQNREIGYDVRAPTACSIIDAFKCFRLDVHHIEGQEYGDLIPPLACSFSKLNPHVLATCDEEGGILLLNTNQQGPKSVLQDWLGHTNAIFDLDWIPGEDRLLTGSGDQTIVLWDVEREEKLSTFRGHVGSIKTLSAGRRDKFVFASGARDGHVMVWDSRVEQKDNCMPAINVLRNAHKCVQTTTAGSATKKRNRQVTTQDSQQSVTAVKFQDDNTLITASNSDGSLKVWDLRKTYTTLKSELLPRHTFAYAGTSIRSHGYSCLTLDSTGTRLFASCMDNIIYEYDCATFKNKPVSYYRGHTNDTFYVKTSLSPCERFLLSGSSDEIAYIWSLEDPLGSRWGLKGHLGEVSAVAWCPSDVTKIVSLSDDSTLRLWRMVHSDDNWEPGELVGTAERTHREIGISTVDKAMAHLAEIRPSPKLAPPTPKKGMSVPPSPAKVSGVMRQNLVAINAFRSPSLRNTAEQRDAGLSTAKTTSPSMASWFGKSPSCPGPRNSSGTKLVGSPLKSVTPRKLIITPRKSPDSTYARSESNVKPASSFKRKLEMSFDGGNSGSLQAKHQDSSCNSSKRRKRIDVMSVANENSCSPQKLSPTPGKVPSDSRVLTPRMSEGDNRSSTGNTRKTLFESEEENSRESKLTDVTPVKGANASTPLTPFQSPTMNLPNYVYDPQPRTPIGKLPEDENDKKPDWLTQLRQEKQHSATKDTVSPRARPPTPKPGPGLLQGTPKGRKRSSKLADIDESPSRAVTPKARKARKVSHQESPLAASSSPSVGTPKQKHTRTSEQNSQAGATSAKKPSILSYFSPKSQLPQKH